jgi:hypothetical protein
MLWKRLRRRSMAPSRPALYPEQIGWFVLTLIAIASGIYVALRFLL